MSLACWPTPLCQCNRDLASNTPCTKGAAPPLTSRPRKLKSRTRRQLAVRQHWSRRRDGAMEKQSRLAATIDRKSTHHTTQRYRRPAGASPAPRGDATPVHVAPPRSPRDSRDLHLHQTCARMGGIGIPWIPSTPHIARRSPECLSSRSCTRLPALSWPHSRCGTCRDARNVSFVR